MEPFDYYVSGVKINHQVPRFEASGLKDGVKTTILLNDLLSQATWITLVFVDSLYQNPEWIKPSFDDSNLTLYVTLSETAVLENAGFNKGIIISDKTHEISNLYGVLDEHTHTIYNSVMIIKNTGQLKTVLSGLNPSFFEENWPQKLSVFY